MIFYITKYALTQGIIEIDTDTLDSYNINKCRLYVTDKTNSKTSYNTKEWYAVKSFALEDAERRRARKIESIQKQIEKLEKQIEELETLEFK